MIPSNGQRGPLIELRDLDKFYDLGSQKIQVLHHINMTINRGDFVSVMGPSGSGKSTLINVLGFLDNEFEGEYLFQGESAKNLSDGKVSALRNKMVGFVFQDFNLLGNMTVKENVQLPLIYSGMTSRSTLDTVKQVLAKVGLDEKMDVYPNELSGGQRQRVAIARALVNKPQFIIADEPTGALDTKTSQAIMKILEDIHQNEQATIIMVTHDPSLQAYANKHIVIIDGTVRQVQMDEAEALIHQYNHLTGEGSDLDEPI